MYEGLVPFSPKLAFMTSCSPLAALMFMNSAAFLPMISAAGLRVFTLDILQLLQLARWRKKGDNRGREER
jgi:hypothetical protein